MVPFRRDLGTSRRGDDNVRNVSEGIRTSIADDIIGVDVRYRLECSMSEPRGELDIGYWICTYTIVVWCSKTDELTLVCTVDVNFLYARTIKRQKHEGTLTTDLKDRVR